jgi:hypothetical protein
VQARNSVRQREFSLRLAMGARKGSIFRQLLCESLLLVCAGAGLGWLFALSATRALSASSGIETGLSPDRTVLLFTLAVSALAALAFGLVPLWSALNAPVAGVLRSTAANTTANRGRVLAGRMVLAAQMAICLVLLMAGGLLLRTLHNYATQNLGIQTEGLLVFGVTPQGQGDSHIFYRTLLDKLRSTPGIESVSCWREFLSYDGRANDRWARYPRYRCAEQPACCRCESDPGREVFPSRKRDRPSVGREDTLYDRRCCRG